MTEPATKNPERKSLAYAEGLGLNSVYERAIEARKALGDKTIMVQDFHNNKRRLESLRIDLEMAIAENLRSANPDLSLAAFDRELKIEINNDAELRETKEELLNVVSDIELLEHEMKLLATDITIAIARLHELGGYFTFMAVVKSTSEARKASEANEAKRDEKDPWK